MKHLVVASLTALLFAGSAAAQIAQRQANQNARINEGIRSGELTKKEAVTLKRKEAALRQEVRRDRIDGPGLTAAERARIDRKQDRLSRQIAKQKHDRQDR